MLHMALSFDMMGAALSNTAVRQHVAVRVTACFRMCFEYVVTCFLSLLWQVVSSGLHVAHYNSSNSTAQRMSVT